MFTFTDPAKIGVITLHDKKVLKVFFRKMWNVEIKMTGDNNESIEQRKTTKTLGFTKFHINAKHGTALKLIKIDREKQTVTIQGRVVLKLDDKGEDCVYMGEGSEVKTDVTASMTAWIAKHSQDDDI